MAQRVLLGWLLLVAAFLAVGCSVAPERHREARLMPPEVAITIVSKFMGPEWVSSPYGFPGAYWESKMRWMCDDWNKRYVMPYSDMRIYWETTLQSRKVHVESATQRVGFGCGTLVYVRIIVATEEEQDDLVDALISLGAKVRVN